MKSKSLEKIKDNTRFYCTVFNSKYLIMGLAMIESLKKNSVNSVIYVLCIDLISYDFLRKKNINNIILIKKDAIVTSELINAEKNRSFREFCWTLSSYFTHYILTNYAEIKQITYLDADLFFFNSVEPIFDEIGDKSIAITRHNFADIYINDSRNGLFCVQWVTFRSDKEGLTCLSTWKDQCLEWCYNINMDGKMADQKYLDAWPDNYDNLCIISNLGAGVAPWNFRAYNFNLINNIVTINDNLPVIFFHFHQFKIFSRYNFFRASDYYLNQSVPPEIIYKVYEKYLIKLIGRHKINDKIFYSVLSPLHIIRYYLLDKMNISFKNKMKEFLWQLK